MLGWWLTPELSRAAKRHRLERIVRRVSTSLGLDFHQGQTPAAHQTQSCSQGCYRRSEPRSLSSKLERSDEPQARAHILSLAYRRKQNRQRILLRSLDTEHFQYPVRSTYLANQRS